MDFVKVEGLGNDFIVVDGPVDLDPSTIVRWCDRRLGIGADGVLEMTAVSRDRIRMRYWNADGGAAEMCGNGLRCLARLAVDRGWVTTTDIVVETEAGDLPASVWPDGVVRALVGHPEVVSGPVEIAGTTVHPIRVGNPHAVIFVDDPGRAGVEEVGRQIEAHSLFPEGANVEFVAVRGSAELSMRVWERGVGETRASGTGATAAAFAASVYRGADSPIEVSLPGGRLTIELDGDKAWMIGPAHTVFAGEVD